MVEIEQFRETHWPRVRDMLDEPSLRWEFDILLPPGEFDSKWNDPERVAEATLLARIDGELAGFAMSFAFPQVGAREVGLIRIGVREAFRRRGAGAALLERAARALLARPRLDGLDLVTWEPEGAGAHFARAMGFGQVRTYWRMRRSAAPAPVAAWPDGITVRAFDGSDAMFAAWLDAYNASFAEHFRFVPSTPESARHIVEDPGFEPEGVRVAFRGEAPVGFISNRRLGDVGLIAALGTAPTARGIGLGRALLRWGVGWHAGRGLAHCALIVDGDNEKALRLYRTEGFEVIRTRGVFARPRPA